MLPLLLGEKMQSITYCYIKQEYYDKNPHLVKILDIDDHSKHSVRTHLCLNVKFDDNNILIPLRKNLGDADRKYGKIGFSAPSKSKSKAGLDYRYMMIINNPSYLTFDTPRIPAKQLDFIELCYKTIESEAIEYINSYIKVAKKNRVNKTARFRESSLINFHNELKIK